MAPGASIRWAVYSVFVLSSSLNYLDRLILATLAPLLQKEFDLSNRDYGLLQSAFAVVYAVGAPFAGLFIDRVGLNRGISLAVGAWSLCGIFTGFVKGFVSLLWARAALGLAEAGGIPGVGKAIRLYLEPAERALGHAVSQIGLSVGGVLAPPVATWLAIHYGWRSAFWVTGALGFLWIPLWLAVSRAVPADDQPGKTSFARDVLGDRRMWGFIGANALGMTTYKLWTNWTTVFLVQEHKLSLADAAWYAWAPPLAFPVGGLLGGWLSWRWIRAGADALSARYRVCVVSAIALLVTALAPFAGTPLVATLVISLSCAWSSAYSVNLYSMPLDAFGAARAAFGISLLTSAYGAMQAVASPVFGEMIDRWGFEPVCVLCAVLPLAGAAVLKLTRS